MSLLREIQADATDQKTELSTLLLKCKVLAARLGSQEFETWINNELTGYKDKSTLPDYRVLPVIIKGNFYGVGTKGTDLSISLNVIPTECQEQYSHSYVMYPISSLKYLIEKSEDGTAREPLSPEIAALFSQTMYAGMNCISASKVIPISALSGILDTVRAKILDFAINIERENPDAGEAALNSNPLPQEKLQSIVNFNIYGGNNNMATNSTSIKQTNTIANNDELFAKLLEAIKDTDSELKNQLTPLIENMQQTQGDSKFKDYYIKFTDTVATHAQILGIGIIPLVSQLAHLMK